MKIARRMDRIDRMATGLAAAILALLFSSGALTEHGGGRPSSASGMRATPTLSARAPTNIPSRRPETPPERPAAAKAADKAATATKTDDGADHEQTKDPGEDQAGVNPPEN